MRQSVAMLPLNSPYQILHGLALLTSRAFAHKKSVVIQILPEVFGTKCFQDRRQIISPLGPIMSMTSGEMVRW